MTVKIGYLLPTRENIIQHKPSGRLLLDAAKHMHQLGVDSLWAGDSLLAKPRHDPLTLLAAVAGAVPDVNIGTAVLLPTLRNPVVLAQQLATIDQVSEGRLIVGAGIGGGSPANRSEFQAAGVPFDRRLGRMMEAFDLCRVLWRGEPVDWDGRWQVKDAELAPTPYRPGGPPIWLGSTVDAAIERTAKHYDGWFPLGPDAETFARRQKLFVAAARTHDKDPAALTTAIYLTVAINPDATAANAAIDDYLQNYYGAPATIIRQVQACCGGDVPEVLKFVREFVDAGAQHIILRVVGDHMQSMRQLLARRDELS